MSPLKIACKLILFIVFFSNSSTFALVDASEVLKKSQQKIKSKDDSATVKMVIVDTDGSTKERVLVIKRKMNQKHMTLVKLKKPTDLKGTALLNIIEKGELSQWLYLPSTKQVRRVMGQKKSTGILGSELSSEDLDLNTIKGAKPRLIKEAVIDNEPTALIEVKSDSNNTQYSKALLWISIKTYLPFKVEYFNKTNKAIKRIAFENYKLINGTFRAQSIKIKNLINQRGTELYFSDLKSNSGLTDDEFSQRALTRE